MNGATDSGSDVFSLVYWGTGVIAGMDVNKSALNKIYDGEYSVDVNYTQTQLENAAKTGKFGFHRVEDKIRVLSDIDSLVAVTLEKGDIFRRKYIRKRLEFALEVCIEISLGRSLRESKLIVWVTR
jgi:hypothetical protein